MCAAVDSSRGEQGLSLILPSVQETENQVGGYGKVISHVIIGLKTVKGLKQLKLDPTIYDNLQKERVQARLAVIACCFALVH